MNVIKDTLELIPDAEREIALCERYIKELESIYNFGELSEDELQNLLHQDNVARICRYQMSYFVARDKGISQSGALEFMSLPDNYRNLLETTIEKTLKAEENTVIGESNDY
ncbi:MAG: hypothetical protein LRZ84_14530 [Desertifilum sp.]|nr:hypothetical protein [Desertifilum sp.]